MTPIDVVLTAVGNFLDRFDERVKKNGLGYLSRCPAHADNVTSLSIQEMNGEVLLTCAAACSREALLLALGLRPEDLGEFPHTNNSNGNHAPHLSTIHRQQLQARGLTDASIDTAQLRSLTPAEVHAVLKFNPNQSGGLGISFLHPQTGDVRMIRVRFDIPPILDGNITKYRSPKGAGNLLYFPPGCTEQLQDHSVPLYLTEGELKALMAYQVGLLTIGLVGVWGFRGKGLNGHKQPIADLDLINWRGRLVVLVYDSDAAINPDVYNARIALAGECYRRGAATVYAVNFPAPDGVKVDFDSFLVAHGADAFHALELEEIPSPYTKPKLWNGLDLQKAVLERPPAIVKALGIRRLGKVILTGAGGRGKSTLLLQMMCNFAAGLPLFGHAALTVSEAQRVLVYMAEDPLSEVKFRWEQQMQALGYGADVAARIAFLDPHGHKLMLTNEHDRRALLEAIQEHGATVTILDPLVSLHDVEENSNGAMRNVLDLFTPFQEDTGCLFLLAHHEPKSPDTNAAASRGASAIRDWCRVMLRLSAQKPGSDGAQRFQLDVDKANYGASVWSLTLERAQDSYLFVPIDLEATITPLQIWELIGSEGGWFDEIQHLLMERFYVAKTTVYRALKKAEERGYLIVSKRVNPESNREKSYIIRGTGPEEEG